MVLTLSSDEIMKRMERLFFRRLGRKMREGTEKWVTEPDPRCMVTRDLKVTNRDNAVAVPNLSRIRKNEILPDSSGGSSPREDLLKFWENKYIAENMKLCVVGKASLDELQNTVETLS